MKAFNNSRTVPFNIVPLSTYLGFPCCSVVKNLPDKEGDAGDSGSIPGSGRVPGVGNGNPLQYSCLGNPMDRGAWQATVPGVTESDMTGQLSPHTGVRI